MQELRIVLIIVGLLAIAALLFHGLWTNRKDSKSTKFGDKPLGKLGEESESEKSRPSFFSSGKKKGKKKHILDDEDELESSVEIQGDPLLGGYDQDIEAVSESIEDDRDAYLSKTIDEVEVELDETPSASLESDEIEVSSDASSEEEPTEEDDLEVIVLSVHCAGDHPFIGTQLFDSMKQNGLLYGAMDIFHRHADLSGTGKVLFSVANMMQPGTLKHDDPAEFTTKGISFFMTLPCFGDPEQNFKLMLKTAQQIADDLGGNVLDDQRNLMTPDRLNGYRRQIQQFKARTA